LTLPLAVTSEAFESCFDEDLFEATITLEEADIGALATSTMVVRNTAG
jgi:hypothetical protein